MMNKCHASLPQNQISFFDFFKLKIFEVWHEEGRSRTRSESEDKHIIKLIVKLNKVVASFPPRFAGTTSELTKVHCCLNSYRPHCIVISCILLFSSVFSAV